MKHRFAALLLADIMVLSLAACGQQPSQAPGQSQEKQTPAINEETPVPETGTPSTDGENGKTVIPFCTSSPSGLGDSGELLEEAVGTDTWLSGKRFQSHVTEADVMEWGNGLGITSES